MAHVGVGDTGSRSSTSILPNADLAGDFADKRDDRRRHRRRDRRRDESVPLRRASVVLGRTTSGNNDQPGGSNPVAAGLETPTREAHSASQRSRCRGHRNTHLATKAPRDIATRRGPLGNVSSNVPSCRDLGYGRRRYPSLDPGDGYCTLLNPESTHLGHPSGNSKQWAATSPWSTLLNRATHLHRSPPRKSSGQVLEEAPGSRPFAYLTVRPIVLARGCAVSSGTRRGVRICTAHSRGLPFCSCLLSPPTTFPAGTLSELWRGVRTAVRSRNTFSQMGAGFESMSGGELQGMTKDLAESRNEAIGRLIAEARRTAEHDRGDPVRHHRDR